MENKLKNIREAAMLSQSELAEKSGVAKTIISHLETGKDIDVKISTLIKIANSLDKSVGEIFLL